MPKPVIPYCGNPPAPAELLTQWNFDPWLLLVMAAGYLALSRTDGVRNGPLMLAGGLMLLLFVSPLCALTSALFSARVAHHLLLVAVIAPLLATALPRAAAGHGSLWGWGVLSTVVFWAWHAPPAYQLSLSSTATYWLMQATLLGSATGFWFAMRTAPMPAAIAGLLGTMVLMGLLGALLTFASAPLYGWHAFTTMSWGMSALQDQQLGGLLMWVAGAGVYLAVALTVASRWLQGRERAAA